LGPVRLAALAGVGIGLVAFFYYLTTRLAEPDLTLLYAELEVSDSSQIVSRLEAQNVPFKLSADGTRVMVPRDQAARLRMSMAEAGLPAGGSIGYEIFDRSGTFGSNSFVQKINHLRALEGELARSVRTIVGVRSARVHLVMPSRQVFNRRAPEPSASIIVGLRSPGPLDKSQVLAIQHLIAAAVPRLTPAGVSVIDSRGNLLARSGDKDTNQFLGASTTEELRAGYESRLAGTIEKLIEQFVGAGKVRAEVSAEMDFDRITTNSETYDPDGQVVRSTQTIEEDARSNDKESQGTVSVSTNLPDNESETANTLASTQSARTEETVNYEISKTVKTHVRETGEIRRLSVAVLIDGTYTTGKDGKNTYKARTSQEIEKLTALVRSTMGYDEKRGDTVDVVNMQFVSVEIEEVPFGLDKGDYFRLAELLILGVVALLVIVMVVRPLMARIMEAMSASGGHGLLADQTAPALAAPDMPAIPQQMAPNPAEAMIDIDQIEGRVKASSVKKVGEIIERHPDEAVGIIRHWMYEES
jgi:flagellar M-ring protein FliF